MSQPIDLANGEALARFRSETEGLSLSAFLAWGLQTFGRDRIVLASSFSAEDQLATAALVEVDADARVFTLDTGRHFCETYDVWHRTQERYGITYEVGFPDPEEIRTLVARGGVNAFRMSVAERKECCRVRKLAPLAKILKTADAWITGLRAEQSVTRTTLERVEWDAYWGIYKLNPLASFTEEQVWAGIEKRNVPYNRLQKEGFASIGCACCTRAVRPGEDVRAGRWWWENPETKECGLHR